MPNSSSESETSTTFSSFSFIKAEWKEIPSSTVCCGGWVTLGMPSGIGPVASVPFGIEPVIRNPGVATLILCRRESLALITHFDAWKVLEIGM